MHIIKSCDLKKSEIIGTGVFGKVHIIEDDPNIVYKSYYIDEKGTNRIPSDFLNEISVYNSIDSENIFLKKSVIDVDRKEVGIFLHKYKSDLLSLIKTRKVFTTDTIKRILFDVLCTMAKAQEKFILHRDIKPANILCNDDNTSLVDWGLANFFYSGAQLDVFTTVQTFCYRSPEQILKYCLNTPTTDMWSIGVVVLEMIERVMPIFNEKNEPKQIAKYVRFFGISKYDNVMNDIVKYSEKHKISLEYDGHLSFIKNKTLKDFLSKCLTIDPEKRLCPIQALNHELFKDFAKPKIEQNIKKRIDNLTYIKINIVLLKKNKIYLSERINMINKVYALCKNLKWSYHELSRIFRMMDKCMEKTVTMKECWNYLIVIIGLFFDQSKCNAGSVELSKIEKVLGIEYLDLSLTNEIVVNVLKSISYNLFFRTFCMYEFLTDIYYGILDKTTQTKYQNMICDIIKNIYTVTYDDDVIYGTILSEINDKQLNKIYEEYKLNKSIDLVDIIKAKN
uniref:Protein kinase domain-containing protein n=1 Tax=viral metagenome TaxID=1070528 RepID=A0A6C0EB29_9ZZZZ